DELKTEGDRDRARRWTEAGERAVVEAGAVADAVARGVDLEGRDHDHVEGGRLLGAGIGLAEAEAALLEGGGIADAAGGHGPRLGLDRRIEEALFCGAQAGVEGGEVDLVPALDGPEEGDGRGRGDGGERLEQRGDAGGALGDGGGRDGVAERPRALAEHGLG